MEIIEIKVVFFVVVLVVVYLVVGVVNIVVVVYYVVVVVVVVIEFVVWDVFEEFNLQVGNLSDELFVVELSNYFLEN